MPDADITLNLFTSLILYKIYDHGIIIEDFSEKVTKYKYTLEDVLMSKDKVLVIDPIIRRSRGALSSVVCDQLVVIYTDRVLSYE